RRPCHSRWVARDRALGHRISSWHRPDLSWVRLAAACLAARGQNDLMVKLPVGCDPQVGRTIPRGAVQFSRITLPQARRSSPMRETAQREASQMEAALMKKLIISVLALTVVQNTAFASPGTTTGPAALALAAVIAPHSPSVRAFDKRVIARL